MWCNPVAVQFPNGPVNFQNFWVLTPTNPDTPLATFGDSGALFVFQDYDIVIPGAIAVAVSDKLEGTSSNALLVCPVASIFDEFSSLNLRFG